MPWLTPSAKSPDDTPIRIISLIIAIDAAAAHGRLLNAASATKTPIATDPMRYDSSVAGVAPAQTLASRSSFAAVPSVHLATPEKSIATLDNGSVWILEFIGNLPALFLPDQ